jgi:2-polyprenyl-6-methoxyphenol hydroxylase-like FAD-dependent oxidoreductase
MNRPGHLADFLPRYEDWHFPCLDVPAVIRNAYAVYEFPMVDRDPLERWTFGRVTLLGDAAHPMYPIGSNGASQAILDAAALAESLAKIRDVAAALADYEAKRRPMAAAIVRMNRQQGLDVILDIVDERAPQGFARIDDVMPRARRARGDRREVQAGRWTPTGGARGARRRPELDAGRRAADSFRTGDYAAGRAQAATASGIA